MTTSTARAAGSTNGVLGHTELPPSKLWQVPVFLVGLLALALAAAAAPFAPGEVDDPLDHDLAAIRVELDKPGAPSESVVAQAEIALGHASRQPERAGEAHYLMGAIYLRQAEHNALEKARENRDKASMHLELAELLGVPPEDKMRLTYLRGKLAYLSGHNMLHAIDLLSKSLPSGATNPAEGYGLLVQAQLRKGVPDLDAALDANLKQMEVCEDESIMTQARMLRGELLLKKELRGEAIKALDAIGPKAPLEVRLKARYLQARAAMEAGMWAKSISWWNELLTQDKQVPIGKGRIYYNLGVCWLSLDRPTHAKEAVQAWRQAQLFGGEEAQAAALRLAELALQPGNDAVLALDHFKDALDKVSLSPDYKNSLVDLPQVRALLEEACRIFNDRQDNEHFLQAAEMYKRIALPGAAEEKVGQAAEANAVELAKQNMQVQSKAAFQQAALAYEQAAETRPPAGRIDVLWRCFECFRRADEPRLAVAVLKKFVVLPASQERQAQAWFSLAELQRTLNPSEARESYNRCVAFNSDAFTSRALLELADLSLAEQNRAEAEDVLKQVTRPPGPIVDYVSHQRALLKLANLYFQEQKFDEAALECKKLMTQYPAHANILSVREQLGECHRILAGLALKNADGPNATVEKKQYYRKVWQENLEDARITYQQLGEDLETKLAELQAKAQAKLPPAEDALRRKAQFVVADCYYDSGNNFEEAFARYTSLWERFRKEPEGWWACTRLYRCWGWAVNAKHAKVAVARFAAEDAIEYCWLHFDEYARLGVFATLEEKDRNHQWLHDAYESLKKTAK